MKVKNMTSARGNKIANQFIIDDGNRVTFQSYDSEIVTLDYDAKKITVGIDYDYSMTTGKYRNLFMADYIGGMDNLKDFNKALKNGFYNSWEVVKAW